MDKMLFWRVPLFFFMAYVKELNWRDQYSNYLIIKGNYMSKNKTWLALFSIIAILFLSGCSSSPKIEFANVTPGSKFVVEKFNLDLVQKLSFPGYLDQQQAQELMEMAFIAQMKSKGLLADTNDVNAVPIEVNVFFRRIYTGEDTPFPIDHLSNIRTFYHIHMLENGKKYPILISKERANSLLSIIKYDSERRDLELTIAVGVDVVNQFEQSIPASAGYTEDATEFKKAHQMIMSRYSEFKQSPKPEIDRTYIPDSVTSELFAEIVSEQRKTRMDGYKKIQKQWLNQSKLFDSINESILSNYKKVQQPEELDELEEQIETIAESGLVMYLDTLELVAKDGSSETLRKFAQDSVKEMRARYIKSYLVHQPLPEGINLDWTAHQLYNMTISDDLDLKKFAVKRIYREYPKNEILLDALSKELEASVGYGYRPSLYSDYHAWICRVLGMSGNQKYKAQLVRLSTEATREKVRDFAEEFADEL